MKVFKRLMFLPAVVFAIFATDFACVSCSPKCLPELVEVHDTLRTTDSVYVDKWRDSIVYKWKQDSTYEYVKDSTTEKWRNDTITITRWRDHYIYKSTAKADSVKKEKADVQYKYRNIYNTITKVEHHTQRVKYTPKFYIICTIGFFVMLVFVLVYALLKYTTWGQVACGWVSTAFSLIKKIL